MNLKRRTALHTAAFATLFELPYKLYFYIALSGHFRRRGRGRFQNLRVRY